MSFMAEFKSFALKGNVIDLAVGVIIGGAFGKIVDSVVSDLILPVAVFAYGSFITVALAEPAPTPEEIVLLREIRDSLKHRR